MKKTILLFLTFVSLLNAQEIYATFNVVAVKNAKLAFVAGGIVKNINANIDSIVKKGDILASLNNNDIKALLDNAKTTLKFAKRNLDRQKKVKKFLDQGKFDLVLSNYEKAKNNLAYQQALYDKTYLKAPFDGIVYYKDIEIGDAVSGMMLKTVFKIQSLHERKLVLEFDQKYNKIVKVGDTFNYKIDGDNKTYTGTISKIYPYANFNNRKIRAEVKAKNIIVGLFGDGTIITDKK